LLSVIQSAVLGVNITEWNNKLKLIMNSFD